VEKLVSQHSSSEAQSKILKCNPNQFCFLPPSFRQTKYSQGWLVLFNSTL